jgi:AAA domain (dynein-related subfamily)
MSAITAALSQIDRVAAEGDLAPDPAAPLELETACDPIVLPDGKRIYPPCLHGQPIDELALALVDSAFVQAMREGWVVMIDEVNTARDVALLSINATLDGRLSLYLAATGETVVARPGFAVLLAYNPGLVGATDIPDAWHSRFPATLEVTSNWPALAELGAPQSLVAEAMRLDRQRIAGEDGLCWTPQFRDIESLWRMTERVGERAALAFFASNLHEQAQAGKIQDAEAAAACRMLDQAGYGRLRVSASSGLPNLHGYPRAVTS